MRPPGYPRVFVFPCHEVPLYLRRGCHPVVLSRPLDSGVLRITVLAHHCSLHPRVGRANEILQPPEEVALGAVGEAERARLARELAVHLAGRGGLRPRELLRHPNDHVGELLENAAAAQQAYDDLPRRAVALELQLAERLDERKVKLAALGFGQRGGQRLRQRLADLPREPLAKAPALAARAGFARAVAALRRLGRGGGALRVQPARQLQHIRQPGRLARAVHLWEQPLHDLTVPHPLPTRRAEFADRGGGSLG
mmetsp:Transcript_46664/g.133522  ORF Transcript_46664/g.133522 Transcript_46664/m.133522 type:complete len:254 (-) Transcript_46664:220-981(-)